MFVKRLSVFLVAAAMAGGLFAAESKPKAKAAEERPDDLICTFETPLGSHIKRRVCATREAREQQREADKNAMEGLRSRGSRGKGNAEPAGL